MDAKKLQVFAWGTAGVSAALAFYAWGQGYGWQFSPLSLYVIFPLFGLVAFSLMWSHYVSSVARQYFKLDKGVLRTYFESTSAFVLAAILLHSGLLGFQLWRDGAGLPPISELNYLPNSKDIYILMGMFSFLVFLAYELRRFYDKKPWWKYVAYASDVAMVLIFIHSLNVGSQLMSGWFRLVWFFYGVTLAGSLVYIYYHKYLEHHSKAL